MTKLGYTNWRGEHAVRDITPLHLWFGITQWHPEPQWFIRAFDHDKQADRDFALSGFGPAPARVAEPVALAVPARDGIEAQRGLNDIFPGDPYPVAHELKRGLDALRARASRGGITSAEVFALTDPLMDILARTALAQEGGRDGE